MAPFFGHPRTSLWWPLPGDPDGSIVSVEFFEGDRSLGIVTDPADGQELFRLLWADVGPGGYVLTAEATDDDGATSVSEPVHIRVLNVMVLPVVTIEATDPIATEGLRFIEPGDIFPVGSVLQVNETELHEATPSRPVVLDTATMTVHRTGSTDHSLTVHYELSGTASNGEDYRLLPGEVTFPMGSASARIPIVPLDDNMVEDTETVVATLTPVDCIGLNPVPGGCYRVGDPGTRRGLHSG